MGMVFSHEKKSILVNGYVDCNGGRLINKIYYIPYGPRLGAQIRTLSVIRRVDEV